MNSTVNPHDDRIVLESIARILYVSFINSPEPILGVGPANATYIKQINELNFTLNRVYWHVTAILSVI
jgi:hypothetical protein